MRNVDNIEVPVGELVFNARVSGSDDKDLVIFLHGFPQSSLCWDFVIDELADEFYCVAFDQRGYSKKARPTGSEQYRIQNVVDDVLGVAGYFTDTKFHLVGHDWGGAVTWATAIFYPEVLSSISALSTPHPLALQNSLRSSGADQRGKSSYIQLFRQEGTAEQVLSENDYAGLRSVFELSGYNTADPVLLDHVNQYVSLLSEPGALTGALNWYRGINMNNTSEFPQSEKLQIQVPTLYVWSDKDVALGKAAAYDSQKYVSAFYRFEVFHDVSHWIPEMAPEKLSVILSDHLNQFKNR